MAFDAYNLLVYYISQLYDRFLRGKSRKTDIHLHKLDEEISDITITKTVYTNVLALIADKTTQTESLLHSKEKSVREIGLYVNTDKSYFMYFNQQGSISRQDIKMVDQFIYLWSNISSTKSDLNIPIGKVWTAMDKLTWDWKSSLPKKINITSSKPQLYVLLYDSIA